MEAGDGGRGGGRFGGGGGNDDCLRSSFKLQICLLDIFLVKLFDIEINSFDVREYLLLAALETVLNPKSFCVLCLCETVLYCLWSLSVDLSYES